ncbi:MAG: aminotransferase class III-fold pyridoxal phosphate-dependent enzyme [Roseococcus sp.]
MRAASWFGPHPPYAVRGEGCWLTDLEGRRMLDVANNFFSLIHGHAYAPVVSAVSQALAGGSAFGLPTLAEIELAEILRARAPLLEQTRFNNSGSEAVLQALRGARAITGRHRMAKFEGAYHGTFDHVEVSYESDPANWDDAEGNPASTAYGRGVPPSVLAETVVLPWNDPTRITAILERHGPSLACVILDPLASRIGMVPASPAMLEALQAARAKHGFLLVSDEVISFRLHPAGAHAHFGYTPDLVALAKIIGGGLPVGAVAGPARHMAVYDHTAGRPGAALSGTFSANPLTMAAGIATLTAFDATAVTRLNGLGAQLRAALTEGFSAHGIAVQVMGLGSLFRVHLSAGHIHDWRSSRATAEAKRAITTIHAALMRRGVLLTPNLSGALSTPMGEAEVALIAEGLVSECAAHWGSGAAWQKEPA